MIAVRYRRSRCVGARPPPLQPERASQGPRYGSIQANTAMTTHSYIPR